MEESKALKYKTGIEVTFKMVVFMIFSIFILLLSRLFQIELTILIMVISWFITLSYYSLQKLFLKTDEGFYQIFRETLAAFSGVGFMIGMFNLVYNIFTSYIPLP